MIAPSDYLVPLLATFQALKEHAATGSSGSIPEAQISQKLPQSLPRRSMTHTGQEPSLAEQIKCFTGRQVQANKRLVVKSARTSTDRPKRTHNVIGPECLLNTG
jgi:hypothetical protein